MSNSEKAYLNFAGGFNTEASLVNFPDGFTSDEDNFELHIDGSRRRRRGLGNEFGGTPYNFLGLPQQPAPGDCTNTFKWENVAGEPSLNFVVFQGGRYLHFFTDLDHPSNNKYSDIIDLNEHVVSGVSTDLLAKTPVRLSFGRGHAFVVGKYIRPFWIKYNTSDGTFETRQIEILERDFEGVEDGISNTAQPTSAINTHTYNLMNRGWNTAMISAFQTSQSKQPSKAMLPWLGQQRVTTAGVVDNDAPKQFSPTKLVSELFQDASAPVGAFIRDPFNTSKVPVPGVTNQFAISTWTISGTTGGTQTVTITTSGNHGLVAGNTFQVQGLLGVYLPNTLTLGGLPFSGFFGGFFTIFGNQTVVSAPTATTLTFTVTFPSNFTSWINQYATKGTVVNNLIDNPSGYTANVRPRAVAFYMGRVWYAGTPHERLSSKVFFSQVIESTEQYGKCYQVASPVDENISDLVPSDGGVISIPEASDVLHMEVMGHYLILYSSNGIWQIGPGDKNYFSANSYSVRRITDIGCIGPDTVVTVEGVPFYWSQSDIFTLVADSTTGQINAKNISQDKINTFFNNINRGVKSLAQGVYDDLSKRIIWIYSRPAPIGFTPNNYQYTGALILDMRLGAWTKYYFGVNTTDYISSIFSLKTTPYSSRDQKIKFFCTRNLINSYQISELNDTSFLDHGAPEQEAFLLANYETIGNPDKQKQSPYVWVFMKKTETGFDSSLTPVNTGSIKMQARWNWADLTVSGKWGLEQEVYRHARTYIPTGTSDTFDDGQPVVLTRNKVRGRGRSLHLKFKTSVGKDAHLLGWKVSFDAVRNPNG